ncbi:MAG: ImmA/IrrE family metallo-endopeptidase [Planktomarina sp.]
MTSAELKRLNATQKAVVKKYLQEYPVKLGSLAKELGVAIKVATLPLGISGQISREEGQYIIRVNRNEARERQRFTIAHELSHFLLHKNRGCTRLVTSIRLIYEDNPL